MLRHLTTTAWLLAALLSAACGAQTSTWSPVGPSSVNTPAYGPISGRITAIAMDPTDTTNNTVYVGATGGGIWKSTNASAVASAVSFLPLTDNLQVFSQDAGGGAVASLSIGALTVQPGTGVVLAGTGDPNGATDSYYGEGLLRSIDHGATWTLVRGASTSISFAGEAFAGFAWSTVSPQTVVAAVTSAVEATAVGASRYPGVRGLYVSTDAGATWSLATAQDGASLVQGPQTNFLNFRGNAATSVVWNPVRKKFYAALRSHGYYESADGATWTRLTNQPGTGLSTLNCPVNTGVQGGPGCPIERGALAVQPVSGDLFALTVNGSNQSQGLWQSTCAKSGDACASSTVLWDTQISATPMLNGGVIAGGTYNLSLAAIPAATSLSMSDTLLFAGAGDLYRCTLVGGCTLRNTTNATTGCSTAAHVAPAQHAIAGQLNPNDAATPAMFFGNDGGLWRSLDGVKVQAAASGCAADDASHFENLNSGIGSLAEVMDFHSDPSDSDTLLAALGTNGSAVGSATGTSWTQIGSGASGAVAFASGGNTWLAQSGSGVALHVCNSGSACTADDFAGAATIGLPQVESDASLPYPPLLIDPALDTNILIGTCRVWRGPADDGSTWSASNILSHMLAGTPNPACTTEDAVIRSLAAGGRAVQSSNVQNSGSPVLYAGLAGTNTNSVSGGHIYMTRAADQASASTLWTDLTGNPVSNNMGGFNASGFDISSIATDPGDVSGMTVYATVMGFTVDHVYRSIDGGSTWTNIAANLPDAPANRVLVDPRDARIVYVALDSGVYVTQDVTTCSSINCWSAMGTALPNAPVTSLEVLPAAGTQGLLRAGTYGRGIWQISLPQTTAGTPSRIGLSETAFNFGTQAPGSTSAPQTLTVTNAGDSVLHIAGVSVPSGFVATGSCSGAALTAGQSCTLQVSFSPLSSAFVTETLTITSDSNGVAGTETPIQLNGNVSAGFHIVLIPSSIDFGSQLVGTTSSVANIEVTNSGLASGAIGSITASGSFHVTANTCGPSLAPQTACAVSLVFAPSSAGTQAGTFTVVDDAGTQTALLTGVGAAGATDAISPLSLTFATQQANTVSALQSLTLTNAGDVPLTVVSAKILAGDFTVVNGCGGAVAAHTSCQIGVGFAPRGVGAQAGTLQITDVLRTQAVSLSGTGVAGPGVSLLPSILNFPATAVGVLSGGQTLTFTNNGDVPLTLRTVAIDGDFGIVAGSDSCIAGHILSVHEACAMNIAFLPTAAGQRVGSITVQSDSDTETAQLLGTGVDFALVANGPTSLTIHSGESAIFSLLLRPVLNANIPVSFACTGVPANATCRVVSQYNSLAAIGTVTVTVLTGTTASPGNMVRAILLLPLLFGVLRRSRRALWMVLFCAVLLLPVGCGSGRVTAAAGDGSGNGSGTPITPGGSYTVTVSATAAGKISSVPLTVLVQ